MFYIYLAPQRALEPQGVSAFMGVEMCSYKEQIVKPFQNKKSRSIGSFKILDNSKAISTDGIVLLFSIKPIICLEVFIFLANSSCVNPSLTLNCFILF